RADKTIGSSLEANPAVHITDKNLADALQDIDLAEIAITSNAKIETTPTGNDAFTVTDVPNVGVVFIAAEGGKCERCWKILPEVGHNPKHNVLCNRCADAVDHFLTQAA